jgi:hypothetical protein
VGWGLLAAGCVGNAAGIALAVASGNFLQNPGDSLLWVVVGAFLVVGCLIVARRPSNRIGWIFTAVTLLTMIAGLAENSARYARDRSGSLPAPGVADWVLNWIWPPTIILMLVFPLLLFPTGRSLSPRWRPVTWLAVGLTAAYAVLGAARPTGINIDAGPLGVILNGLLLFLLAAAVVSLVVRFRRSRGVKRQQLKWFTYAGVLVLLARLSNPLLPVLGNVPYVLVIALPVSVGIAVLRYRVYDIDRLINRTLVYGLLTADARRRVRRRGPAAGAAVRRTRRPAAELGGGRRHPGGGRPVPAGPSSHPGCRGPALQPA